MAIKDPTAALFRRQGGNHLLIVGQNDEAALGVIGRAREPGRAVRAGRVRHASAPGPGSTCSTARPRTIRSAERPAAGRRGACRTPSRSAAGATPAAFLAEVAAEVERRQQPDGGDGPELFLFIHDLARFRDLRRREDDFSFGRRDEAARPADHLDADPPRGPGLGVHVIIWCDTLNNLNRYFARQALREFEMRVLFQMSPTDSGHLLDSPAASQLGPNRALFSSEEQDRLEKFRPYGLPDEGWLAKVREQFRPEVGRLEVDPRVESNDRGRDGRWVEDDRQDRPKQAGGHFGVADGMILVAATAVGLAATGWLTEGEPLKETWAILSTPPQDGWTIGNILLIFALLGIISRWCLASRHGPWLVC